MSNSSSIPRSTPLQLKPSIRVEDDPNANVSGVSPTSSTDSTPTDPGRMQVKAGIQSPNLKMEKSRSFSGLPMLRSRSPKPPGLGSLRPDADKPKTPRGHDSSETGSTTSGSSSETSSFSGERTSFEQSSQGTYESKGTVAEQATPAHKSPAFGGWLRPRTGSLASGTGFPGTTLSFDQWKRRNEPAPDTASATSADSSGSLQRPQATKSRAASKSQAGTTSNAHGPRTAEPTSIGDVAPTLYWATEQGDAREFETWYANPRARDVIKRELEGGHTDEQIRFIEYAKQYRSADEGRKLDILKSIIETHFKPGAAAHVNIYPQDPQLAPLLELVASAGEDADMSPDGAIHQAFIQAHNQVARLARRMITGKAFDEVTKIMNEPPAPASDAVDASASKPSGFRERLSSMSLFSAKQKLKPPPPKSDVN